MADFVFDIALGRAGELYNRVDTNDPANAVLVAVAINANGATDDAMAATATLSALLATAANEVTNSGYARKTLTDALNWDGTAGGTAMPAPDNANNRYDFDIPDVTFAAVQAGDAWTDLIICYDPDSTGGTDSAIIPLTCHDFSIPSPDGSDIVAQIATAGFYRASRV